MVGTGCPGETRTHDWRLGGTRYIQFNYKAELLYPINLKMLFLRVSKVLETRQRLEALVIPKRQALTQYQAL